jgi:two-component system copper resistance phosphate regulon response regulator CusR
VLVLVVEDEPAIADFIERGLKAEGYSVTAIADGVAGEEFARQQDVALVILDVMLPGQDGFAVLEGIRRAKPTLPVVLLTARDTVQDKIRGLDGGATDYVTKPFSFDELAARVRAHLRKPGQPQATKVEAAGISADLLERRVLQGDHEVALSAREFDLLVYLLRHPNQVLSREQILNSVWGYDFDPGTNVVEVYIGYLRRKLAQPDRPAPIATVRSVGYRFDARA